MWYHAGMADLLVLYAPGLSARMLIDAWAAMPALARIAGEGLAATVVVPEGLGADQLERVLLTGMLPEHQGAYASPFHRRMLDGDDGLDWIANTDIAENRDPNEVLSAIDEALRDASHRAIAVVSSWAQVGDGAGTQNGDPLDRPVFITRGIDQPKPTIGICEIAGILERTLTGEILHDALEP